MINSNDFLNMYYALMGENEIECVRLYDIVEIVKAIYSSSETFDLASKLNIEDLDINLIKKHPFTKSVNEDELIEIKISDDEIDSIFDKYDAYSSMLAKAINRVTLSRYFEMLSNGKIKIDYDDSDGVYEIVSGDSPIIDCETKVFTDGKIITEEVSSEGEMLKTKKIRVDDSTYTIVVDYKNSKALLAEIRATDSSILPMVIDEASCVMNGINSSYDEICSDKPKIYKFKIH